MKTKTEIQVNKFGLEIPVEMAFIEKDDSGKLVNDWCFDSYNTAKLVLYRDAIELLPFDKEQAEIATILSVGVFNYLKKIS